MTSVNPTEYNIIATSNVVDERNGPSHFYNRLTHPLHLEGEWKVGIKKMIYNNSFHTIIDEFISVKRRVIKEKHIIPYNLVLNKWYEFSRGNIRVWVQELPKNPRLLYIHINWLNFSKYNKAPKSVEFAYLTEPSPNTGKMKRGIIDTLSTIDEGVSTMTISVFRALPTQWSRHNKETGELEYDDLVIKQLEIVGDFEHNERIDIVRGHYSTIEEVITGIAKNAWFNVTLNAESKHIVISKVEGENVESITLHNGLTYILGFEESQLKEDSNTGDYKPQLDRGRFAFFIYSNTVRASPVGDSMVPLLDVISIPARGEHGDIVSVDVVNPIYQAVAVDHLEEVEIQIVSDCGESIHFDNSQARAKTLLVLHFIKV